VRFTERLDEIGARPSIGTVADSYDNALAETTNGLYKAECVYGPDTDSWDDVDQLELATLSWGHWFNEHRLHGHCGDRPPTEFEAAFYAARHPTRPGLETNSPSLHRSQGGSVLHADDVDVGQSDKERAHARSVGLHRGSGGSNGVGTTDSPSPCAAPGGPPLHDNTPLRVCRGNVRSAARGR
jgi:putative transposase